MKQNSFFKNEYVKVFLLGLLTAFCIFAPFLIVDKGFFLYAGDFNSQQIPFYMYANEMFKNGTINYSWATDLGSSFINSYSFYLLGSPFFWISLLFPPKAVPYLLPYLLMFKFALACLGSYLYLKRYTKENIYAVIGGILYAFCGFSIYNIFFNHFLEAFAFFPFLLWSLDELLYNNKKGIIPFWVALNLLNNYFFFVGQVVFLFIYYFIKVYNEKIVVSFKKFINLAFECLLGCFMGAILFIPSLPNLILNPRTGDTLERFDLWIYSSIEHYISIIFSAILPPDPPYLSVLFSSTNVKWTSLSAFIVLGGLFGFFVFLKHNKKSSFFKIFLVCAIFALVPILNSSFYAFNSSYYARWYYMPILMLVAMNIQSFTFSKEKIFSGIIPTLSLTFIAVLFAITPYTDVYDKLTFNLAQEKQLYLANILIALISILILSYIVNHYHSKSTYASKLLTASLLITLLFSYVHISCTKMPQYESDELFKTQNYDIIDKFNLQDETGQANYRIDSFECFDNLGLFLNQPDIQFFNSTVSPSIMEFYPNVGVSRDVNSKPSHDKYALRSLLSVKYVITPEWEVDNMAKEGYLIGYDEHLEIDPYKIFENNYFIPMGFTYDKYVTYDMLDQISDKHHDNILIRAIAVDENIVFDYGLNLTKLDYDSLYDYKYSTFTQDALNRQNSASSYFEQTSDGFTCDITLNQDNLVFFSVPYDKGFTAYVNGQETDIIKVNYALSAVYCKTGDNNIVFKYKTPYLNLSIIISCFAFTIYIIYLYKTKKRI